MTPLFFENGPLFFENGTKELLFREGVNAEDFNRFKLGRILDRCHGYGTELLGSRIALNVCRQEQVDTRFNSEDTTSLKRTRNYYQRTDDDTAPIKLDYSKDHRPDLKQVMLEMMGRIEGGIPLIGKCERMAMLQITSCLKNLSWKLIEQFKQSEAERDEIADSKWYTEKNAPNLKDLRFIYSHS